MKYTEKDMVKYFGHLENHQFKGYNKALGVKIEGKEHFKSVLEKGNYIPYEKSCEMVKRNQDNQKFNGISEETKRKIYQIKQRADKNGKIAWSDGLVRQFKDAGVDYSSFAKLPKHFKVNTEGGLK
jgi:hypothetical protein